MKILPFATFLHKNIAWVAHQGYARRGTHFMSVANFRRKLTLLIPMFLGRVLTQPNPKFAQPIRNFIRGCIFLVLLLVGSIPLALFAVLTMRTENKITAETEENEDISSIL